MTGPLLNLAGDLRNMTGPLLNFSFPLHRLPQTTQRLPESEIAIATQPQFFLSLLLMKKNRYQGSSKSTSTIGFGQQVNYHNHTHVFGFDEKHTITRWVTQRTHYPITHVFGFNKEHTTASSLKVTRHVVYPITHVFGFNKRTRTRFIALPHRSTDSDSLPRIDWNSPSTAIAHRLHQRHTIGDCPPSTVAVNSS